jgi:TonB family protein
MANAHQVRPVTNSDEVNLEIDDSQQVKHLDQGGQQQPPILVLSRDGELVETVRKAAPRGTRVTHAPDLDHVAEKLPNLRPGVLVADTASAPDIPSMVAQLTQHFPELVVVVAGKREDSASLMQLTATGRIFRFLLTPLSHGQTRLALEAAVAQHVELNAQAERLHGGSNPTGVAGHKNYVVTYGALAVGLLVVIGGIWFGVKQLTGGDTTPVPAPVASNSAVADQQDPILAELKMAKEAFAQGRYDTPASESALDFYRNALRLDPSNEAAKQGIRDVANKVLEIAEEALTSERLEEAVKNIGRARDIDASHPRLAFLDTQIQRERERVKLNQAQEVGNRVRNLVAQANDRMQAGRLLTPAGSSARDAVVEARRLDPTDQTVGQAIRELSNLLTQEARKAASANKPEEAQSYITAAKQLGSNTQELADTERWVLSALRIGTSAPATGAANPATTAANSARRPTSTPSVAPAPVMGVDGMIAEVKQRLNEEKLIEPAGESARDALVNLRNAAPNRPEVEEFSRLLSTRLLDKGRSAMKAKAYERSAQLLTAAREVGARYNEAALAAAEGELNTAREETAQQSTIISASSLKHTKIVQASYPESARKRRIEGWVELAFTIQPNGSVEAVEVQNASPSDVFDDAAIRAVRQWRYEPVTRNGVPIPQRAMVRLKFAL